MTMQTPSNLSSNHTVTSIGRQGSKTSDRPGIHNSYMGGDMSHKLTDQTGVARMKGSGKGHSMSSPAEGKHKKGLKRGMGGHELTDLSSATSQGKRAGSK